MIGPCRTLSCTRIFYPRLDENLHKPFSLALILCAKVIAFSTLSRDEFQARISTQERVSVRHKILSFSMCLYVCSVTIRCQTVLLSSSNFRFYNVLETLALNNKLQTIKLDAPTQQQAVEHGAICRILNSGCSRQDVCLILVNTKVLARGRKGK